MLGSKHKAINIYFAFILQVLWVSKQFATANSLFTFKGQHKKINYKQTSLQLPQRAYAKQFP